MGSALSAEARFLQSLQDELVSRKVHVSKADLCQFLNVVHRASPWFAFTAPKIARSTWLTIGNDLTAFCDKQNDPAFKDCILKYWQLLDGIITAAPISSSCADILKAGEAVLASASRSHTPASPTPSRDGASAVSQPPPYVPPPPSAPAAPVSSSTSSFLPLTRAPFPDHLSPEDEATLEQAAAAYDSRSQPLPPPPDSAAPSQPTPSQFQPHPLPCCPPPPSPASVPLQAFPAILHPTSEPSLPAPPPLPDPPHSSPAASSASSHPMVTRSQAAAGLPPDDGASNDGVGHAPGNAGPLPPSPPRRRGPGAIYRENIEIRDLDQASLKEVRKAVLEYGVQAPYTLSCLESLSFGGNLFPIEWRITVRRCLKPEQIILWEAEFLNYCKELARDHELEFLQISGSKPYDTIQAQRPIPYHLLNLTSQAALRAWKAIPSGGPNLPLVKIQQADDEPYHAFISRLLEAIDRTTGITDTSNPFVKQLAFENANPACRQILKGPSPSRSLEEMISLCKNAHSFATQVAGALVAFQGQNSGHICYSCGRPGHFAGRCPERRAPDIQAGSTSARPSLCPRCRRSRHWKTSCRATTDVEGNYLGPNPLLDRRPNRAPMQGPSVPTQGNSPRGHPQAPRSKPRHINFVPASGAQTGLPSTQHQVLYQHHPSQALVPQPPPSSGPPQVPQDLTCVPPPPTY
ncbi:endogenous retrovirus group K member 8 Gag polyprotein-like [Suncus etruscus]|uniref:endogenous retrovirus group K member 8 Gag polyprotein-like n=1 Tax=Suncus etruscus TaxID=109475 RepID=UPI002110CA20|nr:endogenous retrovirus group K member 8 Gag polyprotein-like [Suncus etruscus]